MYVYVDADILLYKAALQAETEFPINEESTVIHGSYYAGRTIINNNIEKIKEFTKCQNVTLCFSHHENFRKEVYPEYKANRKGKRKPLYYSRLREYCFTKFSCEVLPELEADDVLGIKAGECPESTIIVSDDKDLRTVPCKLVSLKDCLDDSKTLSEVVEEITPEEALKNLYIQATVGDSADNYPGAKGIGATRAPKLYKDCNSEKEYYETALKVFKKSGHDESFMLQMLRCARILRKEDYKEPIQFGKESVSGRPKHEIYLYSIDRGV